MGKGIGGILNSGLILSLTESSECSMHSVQVLKLTFGGL